MESDGKPNDIDDYEGRYGVEDLRQAVTEAKLQGISAFCLTSDRQVANYLAAVFGSNHYALLPPARAAVRRAAGLAAPTGGPLSQPVASLTPPATPHCPPPPWYSP